MTAFDERQADAVAEGWRSPPPRRARSLVAAGTADGAIHLNTNFDPPALADAPEPTVRSFGHVIACGTRSLRTDG